MAPTVMGAAEIARLLGVTRQRLYQIMVSDTMFPEPEATLSVGRVWRRADIERWARKSGRLPS